MTRFSIDSKKQLSFVSPFFQIFYCILFSLRSSAALRLCVENTKRRIHPAVLASHLVINDHGPSLSKAI